MKRTDLEALKHLDKHEGKVVLSVGDDNANVEEFPADGLYVNDRLAFVKVNLDNIQTIYNLMKEYRDEDYKLTFVTEKAEKHELKLHSIQQTFALLEPVK